MKMSYFYKVYQCTTYYKCYYSFSQTKAHVARKLVLSLIYSLITPWSRVLLEKITGFQLVKKFPVLYETRRFITAFTSACQLSLSWASTIQSIPPQPTFWRSILILYSHLRLGLKVVSFPQVTPPKSCIRLSSPPYALHAPLISFFSIYHEKNIGWGLHNIKLLIM
jgi:hypothetical protein